MNNGRICISVCAETADELIEQIKRAEDLADVIEIRFDCLDESDFNESFQKISELKIEKSILITFRSKEEGGHRYIPKGTRVMFWESNNKKSPNFGTFVDCEWELISNLTYSWRFYDNIKNSQLICSFHHFQNEIKSFESLKRIFEEMNKLQTEVKRIVYGSERRPTRTVDVFKIAIQTEDITDSISIWNLLERAKSENKEIIPIAMGEAGKWTRILGLAHGAFLTYAALDSGKETAPGQVSARDLAEVYRAKELDENTEVYGIIAGNTSYTLSPYIHNAAFKFHQLNAVFIPLQVNDLDEFMRRMVLEKTREIELNFRGFSVTNPHKQAIIKYLDELGETARIIGAVNTVKIENGKLCGYNTDANGFIEPLKNAYGDLSETKVAVIGAGGAARACIYALKQENAEVTLFARNPEKAESLAKEFKVQSSKFKVQSESYDDFDILVNTTPLGTSGEFENETPAFTEQIKKVHLAYDLVYNPFETRFLREAKNADIPTIGGLAMLIAQAMEQQKIWTNLDAPIKEMSRAALQKLR